MKLFTPYAEQLNFLQQIALRSLGVTVVRRLSEDSGPACGQNTSTGRLLSSPVFRLSGPVRIFEVRWSPVKRPRMPIFHFGITTSTRSLGRSVWRRAIAS